MASPRTLLRPPILQTPSRSITINRVLPRVQPYNSRYFNLHNSLSVKTNRLPKTSFLLRLFSSSPAHELMASQAKAKAQAIIDDNAVVVFSKSYCQYCKSTKALLDEHGAKYYAIELDQVDDGSAIQAALKDLTGQSSVPNIFINKVHIGGNSDLQGRKSQLAGLLKAAGAV